jgi:hypothetical protein
MQAFLFFRSREQPSLSNPVFALCASFFKNGVEFWSTPVLIKNKTIFVGKALRGPQGFKKLDGPGR